MSIPGSNHQNYRVEENIGHRFAFLDLSDVMTKLATVRSYNLFCLTLLGSYFANNYGVWLFSA